MKKCLLIILFILVCAELHAATITGFSIFVRTKVVPQYVTPGVLNPGPVPVYPTSYGNLVCREKGFSIYGDLRKEVWWDFQGTASLTDVSTMCGTGGQ